MSKSIPELTQELATLQAEKQTFDGLIAEAAAKQIEIQSALDSEKEKVTALESSEVALKAEVLSLSGEKEKFTAEISALKADAKSVAQAAQEIAASFGIKPMEKGSTESQKADEKKPGEGLTGIAKAIAIHQHQESLKGK